MDWIQGIAALHGEYIVLASICMMTLILIGEWVKPTIIFTFTIGVFILLKVTTLESVTQVFANKSILTIFLVIMVSDILQKNYDLGRLLDKAFIGVASGRSFMLRMTSVTAVLSSVLNNTPIVVLLMPYIYQWGKDHRVSPSRLFMPLSFAAIMGGMITVVGTSTNLVLNGFLSAYHEAPLKFIDFFLPGIAITIVGIIYLYFWGYPMLVKKDNEIIAHDKQEREYLIEVKLIRNSKYLYKTIEESGIRKHKGVCLVEILRGSKVINVVTRSDVKFKFGDHLVFTGSREDIIQLVKNDTSFQLTKHQTIEGGQIRVLEVSVPGNSPIHGVMVRDTSFRKKYNAAIAAIHRNGEVLSGRIGEVKLKRGDLILLMVEPQATIELIKRDFFILNEKNELLENSKSSKKIAFLATLGLLIISLSIGFIDIFILLLLAILAGIYLKLTTLRDLKDNVDLQLLAILVCAVSIGNTFLSSGASNLVADWLTSFLANKPPLMIMAVMMVFTVMLTSFITNVAAISVMFPIMYSLVHTLGLQQAPFYTAIAFAASAAFITPIGYQTNLIVAGPGGYSFRDFLRIGFPLTFLYCGTCILVLWLMYF